MEQLIADGQGVGGHDPEARVVRVGAAASACAARTSSTAGLPHALLLEFFTREGVGTMVRLMSSRRSTELQALDAEQRDADLRPAAGRVRARRGHRRCGTARASSTSTSSAGLAVTSLGHAHPEVADAIADQARTLLHVSNLYYNDVQPRVAARLNALLGGGGRVFFCQLGRGGQRVRDQARPPLRPAQRRSRAVST